MECHHVVLYLVDDFSSRGRSDDLDRLVWPWVANSKLLRCAGLNRQHGGYSVSHLHVNFCFAAYVDAAVEVPSGRNRRGDADEAVVVLHESFL